MKYTQWITYKGITIMFVNCARLANEDYLDALKEFSDEYLKRPDCPVLFDITGTVMKTNSNELGKGISNQINRAQESKGIPLQPTAIVGLSAMGRTVASLISPHDRMFYAQDLETAREWLHKNS
jgi:hypothetical protein